MVKLNDIEVILRLRVVERIGMVLRAVVAIAVMTERMMRMPFGLMLMMVATMVVLVGEMNMRDRPLHCHKGNDEKQQQRLSGA